VQPLKDDIAKLGGDLSTAKSELEKANKPKEGADEFEKKYNDEVAAHAATKESLEKAVTDEKAAHETTKSGYAAEKDAANVDGLVMKLLETVGNDGFRMSAAAIPIALKQYDRSVVKRDKEGKVTNADDILKHFREGDFKEFFGKTETTGANVGNSSGSEPDNTGEFKFNFSPVRPNQKQE
jgi:hypothetical protein